ncbi:MAG: UDP-2,3-diacylglucosamine diphosphatase LpxI [Thermodesulfobacteriota bacterium]
MNHESIGIIAGSGQFPMLFARAARERGYRLVTAAYFNEADPVLAEHSDVFEWVHLGQVRKLIRFFKSHDVRQAVMIGAIQKTRMFTDIRPDIQAILLVAKLRATHDDIILRGFADHLEQQGIAIRSSTFLLPDLLAPAGCWTRRKPKRSEWSDIQLGLKLAREIGKLDIGQCIVVAGGSVLAVEAIDGTDATILRGGGLGKGNAVVVKIAKPHQDLRFDMPAVGRQTIEIMHRANVGVLAVEAGKTIVFDRRDMIDLADRCKIAIVAVDSQTDADVDTAIETTGTEP